MESHQTPAGLADKVSDRKTEVTSLAGGTAAAGCATLVLLAKAASVVTAWYCKDSRCYSDAASEQEQIAVDCMVRVFDPVDGPPESCRTVTVPVMGHSYPPSHL